MYFINGVTSCYLYQNCIGSEKIKKGTQGLHQNHQLENNIDNNYLPIFYFQS